MQQLTLAELDNWKKEGKSFQLIDVREPMEHASFNIGGELIPLSSVSKAVGQLQEEHPIIVYCKRGIRSQLAIQRWSQRLPNAVFYNLQGGIYPLLHQS